MRFCIAAVAALIGLAAARSSGIYKRQSTQNDLRSGQCKKVILIFARASTEPGNMGMSMGPAVCSGLKSKLGAGNVACQGVGPKYTAGLADNVGTTGTTRAAIEEATGLFTMAHTKCPSATLVSGGYSQGTAVILRTVEKLPADIKNKIAGIVLFGYTKNKQTGSSIPNFPKDRLMVFCPQADGVCNGGLNVNAGHFGYMGNGSGTKAVSFLVSKINSMGKGGFAPSEGGGEEGGGGEEAPAGKGGFAKGGKGGKGKFGKGGKSL